MVNERGGIEAFHKELVRSLNLTKKPYEIIYIDDHSTDGTFEWLAKVKRSSHSYVYLKSGKQGKAYSLIEGFARATGGIYIMIDADLQYPPSAIPAMVKQLSGADVVVANRKNTNESPMRTAARKCFRFLFGKLLLGLSVDVQSGLKVFTKSVYETVKFTPSSAWTFDAEFLVRASQAGFTIGNSDITASPRLHDASKIHLFKNSIEIGLNAVSVRTKHFLPQYIPPVATSTMIGAGVGNKKKTYITHTTLPVSLSALQTFSLNQKLFMLLCAMTIIAGLLKSPLLTAQILVGLLSILYFIDTVFNTMLVLRSLNKPGEIQVNEAELAALSTESLPTYSILCPLYKEASVLPQFLRAISQLDYPKDKLDILLLLEENDKETIAAAHLMNMPPYVRIIIVPDSQPKTKPKACNYGLSLAKGDYLVIYDAEDIPDPQQLKKALIGFRKMPETVACLQAKLNYYNPRQNLLTRFFTAEYSLWFDLTLTGLQSMNASVPLGGTSNHFKTAILRSLRGWDPFNVTEDADLGVRLFQKGYRTAIIDSTTYEEATSNPRNWLRQRSRWVKGYMQTYLVHMRNIGQFIRTKGVMQNLIFQLTVGGKLLFMLLNPVMWVITLSYFIAFRYAGPTIEAIYIPPVSYLAVISFIFGNFLFLYCYMIACAKRKQWDLMKYVAIIPLYWIMMSTAAFIALYQLIIKPHYWEKTFHGFHLMKTVPARAVPAPQRAYAPAYALGPEAARSTSAVERGQKHGDSIASAGFVKKTASSLSRTANSSRLMLPFKVNSRMITRMIPAVLLFGSLLADLVVAANFLSGGELRSYLLLSFVGKTAFILFLAIVFGTTGFFKKNTLANKQLPILLPVAYIANVAGLNILSARAGFAPSLLSLANVHSILPYTTFYIFALLCFAWVNVLVFHYTEKQSYTFGIVALLFFPLQLYFLGVHHESCETFVKTLAYLSSLDLIAMFVLQRNFILVKTIENNVASFLGLFSRESLGKAWEEKRMRILIFNWRDTKHVYSGGAEVYVHELAKRWVRDGNSVVMFAGNDHRNKPHEVVDGVEIFRRGGTFTVYLFAVIYYIFKFRRHVDVVIDCENGIPFFTPLFVKQPVVLVIHHVHQEIFRTWLRFPLNLIAALLEGKLMPIVYRNKAVVTVSESSRDEIIKLGFTKEEQVVIVHNGVSEACRALAPKTEYPSFMYLGRLKEYKNIDIALKAFAQLLDELPHARFSIVGSGELLPTLKELVARLRISDNVEFLGKVPETDKARLLSKSWVVIQPSQLEGWGITVIEANASGTPVIASKVNGLIDSIVDGKTGLLVEKGSVRQFALAMRLLARNESYRQQLSEEAIRWAKNFTWEESADSFYHLIGRSIGQTHYAPAYEPEFSLPTIDSGRVETT